MSWLSAFSLKEIISTFITLFAVIDIMGSIPIILSLRQKGLAIKPVKATLTSTVLLLIFLFGGNLVLDLFNVDIYSFAVAGSFILFIMALEMILDVEIFKNAAPSQEATMIPIVFPLVAGPAAFTTLLSLCSMHATINILIALVLNLVWVYIVLSMTSRIEKLLGKSGIYIARKFFGVILLAVSVGMCVSNVTKFISLADDECESPKEEVKQVYVLAPEAVADSTGVACDTIATYYIKVSGTPADTVAIGNAAGGNAPAPSAD